MGPVGLKVVGHYVNGLDPQLLPSDDLRRLYSTNDLATS